MLYYCKSINKTDALISCCSDHSPPISFALDMIKEGQRGRGLRKFDSSLLNTKFVTQKS